jgi:transcription antitermination factor NusG
MLMAVERGTFTTAAPVEDPYDDGLRWYIVRAHSGGEAQLHDELLAKGIEAHWPYRFDRVRSGRWNRIVLKGVFPGYVFAGLEIGQSSDDVLAIAPAMYILKNGDRFVEVPSRQMNSVRLHSAEQVIESWGTKARIVRVEVGDWVAAPSGTALQGLPVEIEAIDKRGQISASLGQVKLSFHRSAVTETCTRPFKAIG